jgi:ribosome-associated heat shock protein Hsp15
MSHSPPRCRLDQWLCAARFYKTRSLAAQAVERGRVLVNDAVAKPAKELRVGDGVAVRQPPFETQVDVLALSTVRGPAAQARLLYAETEASAAARAALAERLRLQPEPAHGLDGGRPTKRDQRQLARTADWQRWSASLDDP